MNDLISMVSQNATPSKQHFGKALPYVFAELFSLLIILMMLLSACAPSEQEKVVPDQKTIEASEEAESPPTREAVFVYSDHSKDGSPNISLQLNAEPIQLSSVYVRLAGVIGGINPVALVEVGGKGLSVRRGEKVKEYRVISILPQEINLRRIEGQDNV